MSDAKQEGGRVPVPYELYALRYATRVGRRPEFFLGGDPHDEPMAIDYFVWLARRPGHVCLIDTGFNEAMAKKRRREFLRDPIESLELLGVTRNQIEDVVLTHFHYDHAGNFDRVPNARFHVQDREMQFATGRHMAHKIFSAPYEVDEVTGLVRRVFEGKVVFHDGDAKLTDGISLHHVGGHTMGLQFVRVYTRRGWVVVASDVSHFYEGFEQCRPLPLVYHVGEMVAGYARLREMAPSDDHIVPGHDALVMQKYSAPSAALEGIAVRLDEAPKPVAVEKRDGPAQH
jgi:glyoxylase-like metal-dependent hydrolase (beta-lactamase superfamily II)